MLGLDRVPAHWRAAVLPDAGAVRVLLVPPARKPRQRSPRGWRPPPAEDLLHAPALFVGAAWETLLEGNVRTLIERDLLQPFLQRQRWFGGKARPTRSARFADWGVLRRGPQPLFMTIVEVEFEDGGRDEYFLPLTICAHADARGLEERSPNAIVASITGARKGHPVRRLARRPLRAGRCSKRMSAGEQTVTKRGTVRTRHDRCLRGAPRRRGRRAQGRPHRCGAKQHVDHLRRPADPEVVPAPAARHQSRLRDRTAAHRKRRVHPGADRRRRVRVRAAGGSANDPGDDAAAGREPGRRLDACHRTGAALL